jgi:uncharacterized protein (TIGR03000 family)
MRMHRLGWAGVAVIAALAVLPSAARAQWSNPWECRMLPGGYWQYPNVQWPSDRLFFTGSDDFGHYRVHYPGSGRDKYTVTAADIAWLNDNRVAVIEVRLPSDDAGVSVNGVEQLHTGLMRRMATPPLEPGKNTYEVTAQWYGKDDKLVKDTRTVKVSPGERIIIDFTKPEQK